MFLSRDIRLACLFDGEHFRRQIMLTSDRDVTPEDVESATAAIMDDVFTLHSRQVTVAHFRTYWYDGEPLSKVVSYDDGTTWDPDSDPETIQRRSFLKSVRSLDHTVTRLGKVKASSSRKKSGQSEDGSRKPRMRQKQVDMLLGLDLVSLAIKRMVTAVAVVTGDEDFEEPIRMAMAEGVFVYLVPFSSVFAESLADNVDAVLDTSVARVEEFNVMAHRRRKLS
ncbi:MAG: NYN domain-containing protein [Chlorobi bacterium]|nr:NYN domain-containing protein [Chlorobiota bacterium]NOG67794.1 NYN domain-containing protein [Chlorobiota bacterium]